MSWPYSARDCSRCHYHEALEPPLEDDAGFEIVGLCYHPRIATELFQMRTRSDPVDCPCFLRRNDSPRGRSTPRRPGAKVGGEMSGLARKALSG